MHEALKLQKLGKENGEEKDEREGEEDKEGMKTTVLMTVKMLHLL